MSPSSRKPDEALVYAVLATVDERKGSVFDLHLREFPSADAWHCARWLIDQQALTGDYGLSDIGAITYLHIHRLTQKGRIILEQLKSRHLRG